MDAVWVSVGIVVLGLTLLDVFLTALNYDEAGFLAGRLAAWQWALIRRGTRRMSRRWRPVVLRQVTGLQITTTVLTWLAGVIIGFGLIYRGQMSGKQFLYDGVNGDLFGALYFSAAQLSTVGTSQLTPNTDVLRSLSILETITGVVLVSLILTFLLGIYSVISNLRALSSQFFSAGRGVGEPIASLAPYFPEGQSRDLDSHLQSIADSFGSYTDGVRLHHSAYYFQSGRDTFSLPYSIRMLAGVIGALRWGLPKGHPVAQEPTLLPLSEQFDSFRRYLQPLLGWKSPDVPETVERGEFRRMVEADAQQRSGRNRRRRQTEIESWVQRFIQMNLDMADLVHEPALTDLDEAYGRYVEWLPFAYRSQQFSAAVTHDLDYQPIYSETDDAEPASVLVPAPDEPTRRGQNPFRAFFSRRLTLIDPGNIRLFQAIRALAAAIVAVGVIVAVFTALGLTVMPAAIFGGFIAMYAGSSGGSSHGVARLRSLVAIVPVLIAVVLSAAIPHGSVGALAVMVVLAFVGVGASRFGPAMSGLGQLLFIVYYFTLLMRLQPAESVLFAAAGVMGVVVATIISLLTSRSGQRKALLAGVTAFELRLVRMIEPLIDTVSSARWEPDLIRRVRSELTQTHRTAVFLTGRLSGVDGTVGLSQEQADALRMRVFDAELAVVNVTEAAKAATGSRIPIEVRARLAENLEAFQAHVRAYPSTPGWATDTGTEPVETSDDGSQSNATTVLSEAPTRWPEEARRLVGAIAELQRAVDAVHTAQTADLVLAGPEPELDTADAGPESQNAEDSVPGDDAGISASGEATVAARSSGGGDSSEFRRAIQAGLSTGVALLVGSTISTSYQYWAAMPAYQTLGGTDGETYTKGARRVLGTILGAAVGFGIAIGTDGNPFVVLPALALCVFAMVYFRAASSPLTSFWQTMMFAQLYEFLGKLDTETIELRVLETLIGAVIALLVAAIVLPTRTRTRLAQDAIRLVQSAKEVTDMSMHRLSGRAEARGITAEMLQRAMMAMTDQLNTVQKTAAPLRHSSGSLDPQGIEARLTGYWALLYYTRHLVTATLGKDGRKVAVPAEQWERCETATDGNFAALVTVIEERAPRAVELDLGFADFDDGELDESTEQAIRSLERINETISLLVGDNQAEVPRRLGIMHRRRR